MSLSLRKTSGFSLLAVCCLVLFVTVVNYANAAGTEPSAQPDKPNIIYLVDGVEMSAREVDRIDPADIEKLEFVQDKAKIMFYTNKIVDTVVLITMKREKNEGDTLTGN